MMELLQKLESAAVAKNVPRVMDLADELAAETRLGPMLLLWLADRAASQQLRELGVFYAASGKMHWTAPLVLHHALSCGHPPSDEIAKMNTLTLVTKLGRQSKRAFDFSRDWAGWFIVDCLEDPMVEDDALDALSALADAGTGRYFFSPPALRKARRAAKNEGITVSGLDADERELGHEWVGAKLAASLARFPKASRSFANRLYDDAVRDSTRGGLGYASAVSVITARLAWAAEVDVLKYAQQLFGWLTVVTRKQQTSNFEFATGSLIVQMHATGTREGLPDLGSSMESQSGITASQQQRIRPLLAAVSEGEISLSLRTLHGAGRRPEAWSPTPSQALEVLGAEISQEAARRVVLVTLLAADPAQRRGYARLQEVGETNQTFARLANETVITTQALQGEYEATLVKNAGEAEWMLVSLVEPSEASRRKKIRTFKGTQLPCVSSLTRLLEFLRLVDKIGTAEDIAPASFGVRTLGTINYWANFARSVLALDSSGRLTREGRFALNGGERVLRQLFAESPTALGLLEHAQQRHLADITHEHVQKFVREAVPDVSGSTQIQREEALWRLVKECRDN